MLTSRARLSVGVFSLGVHRLTCTERGRGPNQWGERGFNRDKTARTHTRTVLSPVRRGKRRWLPTRNQMPNWLRSRWSCWSSSLLSNSMLSREWWEEERPIWRRLFSSNSRCSAWISASFKRLRRGGEREGNSREEWKRTRLDWSHRLSVMHV